MKLERWPISPAWQRKFLLLCRLGRTTDGSPIDLCACRAMELRWLPVEWSNWLIDIVSSPRQAPRHLVTIAKTSAKAASRDAPPIYKSDHFSNGRACRKNLECKVSIYHLSRARHQYPNKHTCLDAGIIHPSGWVQFGPVQSGPVQSRADQSKSLLGESTWLGHSIIKKYWFWLSLLRCWWWWWSEWVV